MVKIDINFVEKGIPTRKYNSSKYAQHVERFLKSSATSAEIVCDDVSPKAICGGLKRAIDKYFSGKCEVVIRENCVFLKRK